MTLAIVAFELVLLASLTDVSASPPSVLQATLSTRSFGFIDRHSEMRSFYDVALWNIDFDQPLFTRVVSQLHSHSATGNMTHERENKTDHEWETIPISRLESTDLVSQGHTLSGALRLKCGHRIIESLPDLSVLPSISGSIHSQSPRPIDNTLFVLPGSLPRGVGESEIMPQLISSVGVERNLPNRIVCLLVQARGGGKSQYMAEKLHSQELQNCKIQILGEESGLPQLMNSGGEIVRSMDVSSFEIKTYSSHQLYNPQRAVGAALHVNRAYRHNLKIYENSTHSSQANSTKVALKKGADLIDRSSIFSFMQVLHSVGHYQKLEANQYFELIEDPLLAILQPAIVSILVSILKSLLLTIFGQIVPPIIAMVMICPIQKFMFLGQPCKPEGNTPDPDMPPMPELPSMPRMPSGQPGPDNPGQYPQPKNSRQKDIPDDKGALDSITGKSSQKNSNIGESDENDIKGDTNEKKAGLGHSNEDDNGADKNSSNAGDGNKTSDKTSPWSTKMNAQGKHTLDSNYMASMSQNSKILPSTYLRAEAHDHRDQLEYAKSVLDVFAPAGDASVAGLRNEILLHAQALDATMKAMRLAKEAEECERGNKCTSKENQDTQSMTDLNHIISISNESNDIDMRNASRNQARIDRANQITKSKGLYHTKGRPFRKGFPDVENDIRTIGEIHNLSSRFPEKGVIGEVSEEAADFISSSKHSIESLREAAATHEEAIETAMIEIRERFQNKKDKERNEDESIDEGCARATEPSACKAASILKGNEKNYCVWVTDAPQTPSSICTSISRLGFKLGPNGLWREDEKMVSEATEEFKMASAIQGSARVKKITFKPYPQVGKFDWVVEKLPGMKPPAKKESPNPQNIVELTHMASASIIDKTYAPLERTLYVNLLRSVNSTVARVASRSLTQTITARVTTALTENLASSLRITVARVTSKRLIRALTPSLTQTLSATLSQALTRSPKSDYYCSLCRQHRLYCSYCYEAVTSDAEKEYYSSYYSQYYSEYYSSAYSSSLSDNFVLGEISREDDPKSASSQTK